MTTRQDFIRNVRNAVADDPLRRPVPGDVLESVFTDERRRILEKIRSRSREERDGLLADLTAAAEPLRLNMAVCADAEAAGNAVLTIAAESHPEWNDRIRVMAWRHPLLASLELARRFSEKGIDFHEASSEGPDLSGIRHLATVGITSADHAVAESATLVMKTRPGQDRWVSLLPSIHIAVIRQDRILSNFRELYTVLSHHPESKAEGLGHGVTFITGPSKTADIEATMVHGAHGPREVHLIVIKA